MSNYSFKQQLTKEQVFQPVVDRLTSTAWTPNFCRTVSPQRSADVHSTVYKLTCTYIASHIFIRLPQ